MRCPACRTVELTKTTYEGFTVNNCPECFGHLIPRQRTEGIKRRSTRSPEDLEHQVMLERGEDSQRLIGCPYCGVRMQKMNKARPVPFQIDFCRKCDMLWLDGGELALLQLSYESSAQAEESREMRRRWEEMSDERKQEYRDNLRRLPKPSFQRGVWGEVLDALHDSDW
ncbi:MAG: zf-TFIIB domain-containing protein [Pirellulales bacterium]|nr:zf-TFIIB domain-containing protein [Pirellulales bacterium]